MLNWLKRSLGGLLALCMLISLVPTALAADRSELEDHWASESLTYFADEGWLQGYKDGTYRPDSKISRAEFITILNRVCGFTQRNDEAAKKFTDVKETDWYFEQVSIALAAGYTNGTSATTMSPRAQITRQEAFTMIARVAGVSSEELSVLDKFTDADTIGNFAKPAIAGLTAAGYVEGYKDGKLLPRRNISRAEAVKTMYSCLDLLTSRYVLMNIPYADFYAAELQNDVAVDGVTSATLNKTRTPGLVGGSYHVNSDGTDITGITFPVKVGKGVSLKEFTRVTDESKVEITVTNRGNTTTTTYTGKDALFESASYSYYVLSEAPACYKEATLNKDGKLTFGAIEGAEAQELTATATLSTSSRYGDYQVDVDLDDDTVKKLGNVYGVIFSTKERSDYGMRHLENVWRTTEIAWCSGFTSEVHGCPTSSDHYKAMMGQTIDQITYITESGLYTIAADLYVPVKTGSTLEVATALASAKETTVTAVLPEDYQPVYAVTSAKGETVSGMEVKDGKLTWSEAAIGAYTLTVTDKAGKYAPLSASFQLQTDAMPAEASADNQSIVKTADATDADFAAFVAAISNVNVNGTDYAASGKRGVKVIKEDGAIDFTTAPFQAEAKDGAYVLTITATGYEKTLTVTVPATYYLYASLTYEEYWSGEGVYAADNTSSSQEADSRGEYDKGGYDAVTRATSNHGLHRGSYQQDVTIHTESGKDYYPLYWTDANNFVDREDGKTYNKTEIGIKSYEITGIKYVPVAVRAQDYAQFVKDYEVTLNGETLYGGFSEKNLSAYTEVAQVTANTNGLKAATLTGGKWSFGARQTGTDSGLKDKALTTAEGAEGAVKTYSGNYGEFLRFDVGGNYGGLGAAMQTVKWTYYGTDSTYTTPLQTYGTKFAADNWMHKAMGIQLGLTDSIRCQLPEGTDGTGYWTVTIYGLGYADYTAKFEVTAENLPAKVAPMTDEQKTQLTALKDQAGEILSKYDDAAIQATPALAALKEHYDEAVAMLANPDATEPEAAELIAELPALIEAAKPQSVTYTGTATTTPDEDGDFTAYLLTAKVTVEGGKITAITAEGGGDENAKYLGWAVSGRTRGGKDYVGVPAQLIGKTVEEVTALSTIDAVSGATCSSNSILEAVQTALKNPAA